MTAICSCFTDDCFIAVGCSLLFTAAVKIHWPIGIANLRKIRKKKEMKNGNLKKDTLEWKVQRALFWGLHSFPFLTSPLWSANFKTKQAQILSYQKFLHCTGEYTHLGVFLVHSEWVFVGEETVPLHWFDAFNVGVGRHLDRSQGDLVLNMWGLKMTICIQNSNSTDCLTGMGSNGVTVAWRGGFSLCITNYNYNCAWK